MPELEQFVDWLRRYLTKLPDRVVISPINSEFLSSIDNSPIEIFEYRTLNVPASVVELYAQGALWGACQTLAAECGCELNRDHDGGVTFRKRT